MIVPNIDRNDAHVPRVNLLACEDDFARDRIAGLKRQLDLGGPSLSDGEERIGENEGSERDACGKQAEEDLPFHNGVERKY